MSDDDGNKCFRLARMSMLIRALTLILLALPLAFLVASLFGIQMLVLPALLVIAVVPAICEELFFRGLLLSGLRTSFRPWPAIVWSACAFGVFHFLIFKFAMTVGLGVLLGWLCWRSRSIWPGMLAHAIHNSVTLIGSLNPAWQRWAGIDGNDPWPHLPIRTLLVAGAVFAFGIVLIAASNRPMGGPGPSDAGDPIARRPSRE